MGYNDCDVLYRLDQLERRLTQLETGKPAKAVKVFYPQTKDLAQKYQLTQIEQLALLINQGRNNLRNPDESYCREVVRVRGQKSHGLTSLGEAERLLAVKPPLTDKQIDQLVTVKHDRTPW